MVVNSFNTIEQKEGQTKLEQLQLKKKDKKKEEEVSQPSGEGLMMSEDKTPQ